MEVIEHAAARRLIFALALALLLAVVVGGRGEPASGALAGDAKPQKPGKGDGGKKVKHPNVVVLLTDDQDLASMRVMPQVRKLIGDEGVTLTNYYTTNPVCCPSRTTGLTGEYAHNTGVFRNSPPNGGITAFDDDDGTLPIWLQRGGYYTGHIGKYVNGYGAVDQTEIPPGWSEWYGSIDPGTYRMYGYTLNENGHLVTYGDYDTPDPANYQTDVYADKAVDFIQRRAPSKQPFYLSINPLAPHVEVFNREDGDDDAATPTFPNPRPAPRYAGRFAHEKLPRGPAFNEADISDKPSAIRARPLMTAAASGMTRNRLRSRLGSLLAVDDMVKRIVGTLRKTGDLSNTVIMFMSDNGFMLGEHRIPNGKQYPYEESANVPFEMRGPGIPKNEVRDQPAANIDLAPTILDLANVPTTGSSFDGRSIMPMVKDQNYYPGRAIVLENWCQTDEKICYDPANPTVPRYRGVRTDRYAYMQYPNGEQEMYDLEKDPYELDSLQNSQRYAPERAALSKLLAQMQFCKTKQCRAAPNLKLNLKYQLGTSRGKRCVKSAVTPSIGGGSAGQAVSAEFILPAKNFKDKKRPVRTTIAPSRLNHGQKTPIQAEVSVLDGRITTVSGSVPRAC